MTGLVVYLAGPGKSNEHENPHVVAGHESIVFAAPAGELSHEDAIALAGELDTARVVFGTEVSVTSRRKMNAAIDDGVPRSVALADATSDQNVWHCSLSLSPEEGELSDEKWATIAADFMKEMDFDNADSPRAPARWVAIRHGKTTAGGDHIHIAASAVREDGTKVNTFNDFKRAQAACNTGTVWTFCNPANSNSAGVEPSLLSRVVLTARTCQRPVVMCWSVACVLRLPRRRPKPSSCVDYGAVECWCGHVSPREPPTLSRAIRWRCDPIKAKARSPLFGTAEESCRRI